MKKILLSVFAFFLMAGLFAQTGNVTFNVDMSKATTFNPKTDSIFLAGSLVSWAQPGSVDTLMLTPNSDSSVYSITVHGVANGMIQYKYFIINNGPDWNQGEWPGDPNRFALVDGDVQLDDTFGDTPVPVVFKVDVSAIADSIKASKAAVFLAGDFGIGKAWAMPGELAPLQCTPNNDSTAFTLDLWLYKGTKIQYKNFLVFDGNASWSYGEWDGGDNRMDSIADADTINTVWGEMGFTAIPTHNADQPSFNVYPNPVHDVLYIDNLENANRIEIYNVVGQRIRVIREVTGKKLTIQTSDLNNGVYVVSAFGKNGVLKSMKFIKK
jgi:hypothetical protein